MSNLANYLIIVGVSGTGKTTLREGLIEKYPDTFFSINQVTTREKRITDKDDDYLWLNDNSQYHKIEHLLIGKCKINGNLYGSIPPRPRNDSAIGVIVLNEQGLLDFFDARFYESVVVVGLDKELEDLTIARENRDSLFLLREKRVLDHANVTFNLGEDDFADPEDVRVAALQVLYSTSDDFFLSEES